MEYIFFKKIQTNSNLIIELPDSFKYRVLEVFIKPLENMTNHNNGMNLRGTLSEYANIKKINLESKAWINSVKDDVDC